MADDTTHEREVVVRAIKSATGLDIPEGSFKKSHATLFLNIHPAIRGEILMRKEEILSLFKKEGVNISNIS